MTPPPVGLRAVAQVGVSGLPTTIHGEDLPAETGDSDAAHDLTQVWSGGK